VTDDPVIAGDLADGSGAVIVEASTTSVPTTEHRRPASRVPTMTGFALVAVAGVLFIVATFRAGVWRAPTGPKGSKTW
jgi:hypothetical protein